MPKESVISHEVTTTILVHKKPTKVTLDVFGLAAHDIILGLPWLRETNPVIDWKRKKLSFEARGSTRSSKPAHWQRPMADEMTLNNIASH
jgi:hypothetical protein